MITDSVNMNTRYYLKVTQGRPMCRDLFVVTSTIQLKSINLSRQIVKIYFTSASRSLTVGYLLNTIDTMKFNHFMANISKQRFCLFTNDQLFDRIHICSKLHSKLVVFKGEENNENNAPLRFPHKKVNGQNNTHSNLGYFTLHKIYHSGSLLSLSCPP